MGKINYIQSLSLLKYASHNAQINAGTVDDNSVKGHLVSFYDGIPTFG
jgi:hypothetical protein